MVDDPRKIADHSQLHPHRPRALAEHQHALAVKAVFFALTMTGTASLWIAVLADMCVSLVVIAYSLRLLRRQPTARAPTLAAEPPLPWPTVTQIGRRQLFATVGAGLTGLAAVLAAGCSDTDAGKVTAPPDTPAAGGALSGLVFEVRRDPG